MSWGDIPPDMRELIEQVCTPKEVDALKLEAQDIGTRGIAVRLGISREAARDRLANAKRKILNALEERGEGV